MNDIEVGVVVCCYCNCPGGKYWWHTKNQQSMLVIGECI